mgnify:CR=1 FL=1
MIPPSPTNIQNKKILLIDSDPLLRQETTARLQAENWEVDARDDGYRGISGAMRETFDLIIIASQLSRLDGYGLLKRARLHTRTPIMILDHDDSVERRMENYRIGADDVLLKPFQQDELIIRVASLLRRVAYDTEPELKDDAPLSYGKLQVDRNEKTVFWGQTPVPLTDTEFQLLAVLLQNRGEILSKPYLQILVTKRPFVHHDRSIDMHISNLRRKLAEFGHPKQQIRSVRGLGYSYQ